VTAAAALLDVLRVEAVLPLDRVVQELLGVAQITVRDQVDVVARGRVVDGDQRVADRQLGVVRVLWLFEVRRPGVVRGSRR